MTIRDLLLPEFDHEIEVTRTVLSRVPDDRSEWKPHPKAFPMGHLAQLVARMPGWTMLMMSQTEFDIEPPGESRGSGYTFEKTATLLAELDRNASDARAAIDAASDELFSVPWTLKKGGVVLSTQSRYQMLRSTVLNHLVHHRAQLGMYLRLAGLSVPEMYGATADEGR